MSPGGVYVDTVKFSAASADVLQFRFRIDEPRYLLAPTKALEAITRAPHDANILSQVRAKDPIAPEHLSGRLHVGGGIVVDSVPEQEWQETLDKARAFGRVEVGQGLCADVGTVRSQL